SWRRLLLHGAKEADAEPFYVDDPTKVRPAQAVADTIRRAIGDGRGLAAGRPCLVWCFVDLDLHVHRHGYDCHAHDLLLALGDLAASLAERAVIVAHADHGLVATSHSDAVADTF